MDLASSNMISGHRYTLSNFDVSLVKTWIHQCTSTHVWCNRNKNTSWYPTRLLELSKDGRAMRLVITEDKRPSGPYMTLSHRWSRTKYRYLTSQTSTEFQQGIDVSSLPMAFQEAGILARKLDVGYLWIDSLCIEQDSDLQDWHREAPKMHQVYGHSFLNLAATLSPDIGTSSLFDTDIRSPFMPMQFTANEVGAREHKLGTRIRCRRSHQRSRHRRVYKIRRFRAFLFPRQYYMVDGNLWEHEVEDTVLQTRAWVYQERLLAPRVLHFGKRQLAWECKEHTALELFPRGLPTALTTNTVPEIMSAALSSRITDASHASFRNAWHNLVNRYTKCGLTKSADKLIALAGVVSLIERARGDQYLAGTWKSTMITDLSWTAFCGLREDTCQTRFRAPTWSWLSLEAEISFPDAQEPSWYYAEICEYPSPDEAGSSVLLAHGTVAISGVLLPVTDLMVKNDCLDKFRVAGIEFVDGWTPNASHFDLDDPKGDGELVSQQNVFMLPLYSSEKSVLGIAIARSEEQADMFRRVGSVTIEYRRMGSLSQNSDDGWIARTHGVMDSGLPFICHYNLAACNLIKLIQRKIRDDGQEKVMLI